MLRSQAAFSRLSLAFRCDQYTLCQRLETEEHARDNAEDNLKLEVERGMEVLEVGIQFSNTYFFIIAFTTPDYGNY